MHVASRTARSLARCACVAELRAVCAILFGVSALCVSFLTFAWLMALFVAFLLVDSALVISCAVLAARQHERGTAPVLPAIAGMLIAASLLLVPTMTVPALVMLLAFWATVTGALGIGAARRAPRRQGRRILLTVGALSICWAGLLCLTYDAQPMALAWWLGLYALSLGCMLLLLAPRLRMDVQ